MSPVGSTVFANTAPRRQKYVLNGVVTQGTIDRSTSSITLPSGEVINSDGTITGRDGQITKTTYRTETRYEYPDGTIVFRNGLVIFRDGSIVRTTEQPDGSFLLPDGSIVSPDGRRQLPEGDVIQQNTIIERFVVFPDGRLVFPDGRIVRTSPQINGDFDYCFLKNGLPSWICGFIFFFISLISKCFLTCVQSQNLRFVIKNCCIFEP